MQGQANSQAVSRVQGVIDISSGMREQGSTN